MFSIFEVSRLFVASMTPNLLVSSLVFFFSFLWASIKVINSGILVITPNKIPNTNSGNPNELLKLVKLALNN